MGWVRAASYDEGREAGVPVFRERGGGGGRGAGRIRGLRRPWPVYQSLGRVGLGWEGGLGVGWVRAASSDEGREAGVPVFREKGGGGGKGAGRIRGLRRPRPVYQSLGRVGLVWEWVWEWSGCGPHPTTRVERLYTGLLGTVEYYVRNL